MAIRRQSAGILLYRFDDSLLKVFLVHPGGPFWKGKDAGAWSIPKGEFTEEEEPLAAAKREFEEETGTSIEGNFIPLSPVVQKGGKCVHAWAIEGYIDAATVKSNLFTMEWPPKSGKWPFFPEVDKGNWFTLPLAKEKINAGQAAFLDQLLTLLSPIDPELA